MRPKRTDYQQHVHPSSCHEFDIFFLMNGNPGKPD